MRYKQLILCSPTDDGTLYYIRKWNQEAYAYSIRSSRWCQLPSSPTYVTGDLPGVSGWVVYVVSFSFKPGFPPIVDHHRLYIPLEHTSLVEVD